jgi:hypothetical protein
VATPSYPETRLVDRVRHSAKTMSSALRFVFRSAAIPRAALASTRVQTRFVLPQRAYASSAGLGKDDIQKRVLDVLKGFERVDQTKVRGRMMVHSNTWTYDRLVDTHSCLRGGPRPR